MTMPRVALCWVPAALALLATPAAAQFDPAFNHLQCHKIKGARVQKAVATDTQFNRTLIVKMVPQYLCTPTRKTCCVPGGVGCQPTPCQPDPAPIAAVPHFKCYKVSAKACVTADCVTLGKFPNDVTVNLLDQFAQEIVRVGAPQLLCAPVQKTVITPTTTTLPTTTTTSTSTTTTEPPPACQGPDAAGMCNGGCPPGRVCLAVSPTACNCVDQPAACGFSAASGQCQGLCDNVNETCQLVAPNLCDCAPASGCDQSPFPTCGGTCPAGQTCQGTTSGTCRCN